MRFVGDFAEQDLDVVLSEEGGEGAVLEGGEKGGRDKGGICSSAEGVLF